MAACAVIILMNNQNILQQVQKQAITIEIVENTLYVSETEKTSLKNQWKTRVKKQIHESLKSIKNLSTTTHRFRIPDNYRLAPQYHHFKHWITQI